MSIFNNIKVLAIDLGEKRSGLAFYDPRLGQSLPLRAILAQGKLRQEALLKLLQERMPDLILFGLPLSADGSLNLQSESTLRFARRLKKRLPDGYSPKISFINEFGSSEHVQQEFRNQGIDLERKSGSLDSSVALSLLEEARCGAWGDLKALEDFGD